MITKKKGFWSSNNRFRLMLTLELAVMPPAATLIYLNFSHVKSIKRNKDVEASIHRDFHYMLAASEKHMNDKVYGMTEEVRELFQARTTASETTATKLQRALSERLWP